MDANSRPSSLVDGAWHKGVASYETNNLELWRNSPEPAGQRSLKKGGLETRAGMRFRLDLEAGSPGARLIVDLGDSRVFVVRTARQKRAVLEAFRDRRTLRAVSSMRIHVSFQVSSVERL